METKQGQCPVIHGGVHENAEAVTRYQLVTTAAQRHIDEPGNSNQVTADLEEQLTEHFDLMKQLRPEQFSHRIARGLRGAAFTAIFHIAATDLEQSDFDIDEQDEPAFKHVCLRTEPALRFAERTSRDIHQRWWATLDGMQDSTGPLSGYQDLADSMPLLNQRFMLALEGIDPEYKANRTFAEVLRGAAEDNAIAQLGVLLAAGHAYQQHFADADPDAMAQFARRNVAVLGSRASVNRTTSAAMSVYREDAAPGYLFNRQVLLVEYEDALQEGRPIKDAPDLLSIDPDRNELHWGSSLRSGPWREPGYCAAYPELRSYNDPNRRFRTIDFELIRAASTAAQTIFRHWPG